MKTKLAYMSLLLVVFTTNCKNSDQTEEEVNLKQKTLSIKSITPVNLTVANTANPFDNLGAIHNEGLQELFNYTSVTGDTTGAGRRTILKRFIFRRFNFNADAKLSLKLKSAIIKDYCQVHNLLKMSSQARSFVGKFNQAIGGIKRLGEFNDFRDKIISIEQQILDSKLSLLERNALLQAASVMRYSAFYWFNFANTNEKAVTMGLLRKIAGIITGIAADGTSALYYAFVSASIFELLERSIEMSEMCGFYTGGFSYW